MSALHHFRKPLSNLGYEGIMVAFVVNLVPPDIFITHCRLQSSLPGSVRKQAGSWWQAGKQSREILERSMVFPTLSILSRVNENVTIYQIIGSQGSCEKMNHPCPRRGWHHYDENRAWLTDVLSVAQNWLWNRPKIKFRQKQHIA